MTKPKHNRKLVSKSLINNLNFKSLMGIVN